MKKGVKIMTDQEAMKVGPFSPRPGVLRGPFTCLPFWMWPDPRTPFSGGRALPVPGTELQSVPVFTGRLLGKVQFLGPSVSTDWWPGRGMVRLQSVFIFARVVRLASSHLCSIWIVTAQELRLLACSGQHTVLLTFQMTVRVGTSCWRHCHCPRPRRPVPPVLVLVRGRVAGGSCLSAFPLLFGQDDAGWSGLCSDRAFVRLLNLKNLDLE